MNNFEWGPTPELDQRIIAEEIFQHRVYEKFHGVKEGDVVMDIGANVGAFTHSILDKNPSAVYCVEPSSRLIETLKKNTDHPVVKYINKAIFEIDGTKQKDETANVFNMVEGEPFESIRFDTLLKEEGITHIDFLKCDCESGEYSIFTAENYKFIRNNVRWISGEWHIWGFENVMNRFCAFRDLYLKGQRFCVHDRNGVNLNDRIFDNDWLNAYANEHQLGAQLIIYIDYRISPRLEGLPPVYWLTLANEKERQASMTEQFSRGGIDNHTMVEGFDGRTTDYRNTPAVVGGVHFDSINSSDIAVSLGHIKMLQTWINTSTSEYALFLENDVDLSNSENWSFDWKEFFAALPNDWDCVQLALIKAQPIERVSLRRRVVNDWSVTAYLLRRSYAKKLLQRYVTPEGKYWLEVPGDPKAQPIIENLIYFPAEDALHCYTAPVFVEKNTFYSSFFAGQNRVKEYNSTSAREVQQWWIDHGKTTTLAQFMNPQPEEEIIPMIGTAVVKNPKWVRRLVNSVDFPVKEFLIINNNGKGEIDAELDEIARTPHLFIHKIRVTHMPANLGVPGSWNLMIKCYMKCPYWIIVNDDVAFGAGFLREMYVQTTKDPSQGMIHGYQGDYGVGSWDLFLIRDFVIAEFGLFDENLYPAYNEDADYFMRFIHRPIRRLMNIDRDYYHGDGKKNEYHIHGSQTGKSDSALKKKLDAGNMMNIDYLNSKWGEGWRHCSPTQLPFEKSGNKLPISYGGYDLRFVRRKHLGF